MDLSKMRKQAREMVERRFFEQGSTLYKQILELEPKSLEDRKALRACHKRMYEGKKPSALWQVSAFVPMLKIQSTKPEKDPIKVLTAGAEVLTKNPFHAQTLAAMGMAAFHNDDLDTANYLLEEALALNKENKGILSKLVEVNKKERPQRALDMIERYLKLDPNNNDMMDLRRDMMASVAMDEGKWEDQKSDFKSKVKGGIEAASRDAQDLDTVKDKDDAARVVAQIDELLAEDPKNTKLILKKANMWQQVNELDSAAKAYQDVLNVDKSNIMAKFAIGDIKIRKYDMKLEQIRQKLKKNPEDQQLKSKYNEVLKEKLKYAISEFVERVNARPTDLGLRYRLGLYLYQANQVDKAIEQLQQAVNDPQVRAKASVTLADCFAKKDLPDFAIKQLEKAQKAMPVYNRDAMDIDYRLAKIHEQQGEKQKAREYVTKIAEKDFNFRDVQAWLKKLGGKDAG